MFLVTYIFIADFATATFYFLFDFVGTTWFPVGAGFVLTALSFLSLKVLDDGGFGLKPVFSNQERKKDLYQRPIGMIWWKALVIGLVQGLSLLPGISRMGLTFVVGRWLGLDEKDSFEFSFLIILPLFSAAFVKGLGSLIFKQSATQVLNIGTVWVMLASGVVAYSVLCLVARLAYARKVWLFSIYFLFPILWYFFLRL